MKPLGLAVYWQQKMYMLIKSSPEALSPKQAGQLKQLLRRLGPYAKPVVDYAFASWAKFTAQVIHSKALATCPDIPHIGFLLAHSDVAIDLMIKEQLIINEDFGCAMKALYGEEYYAWSDSDGG
jgi:hypothetical protein